MRKVLVIQHIEHEGPGAIGAWFRMSGLGADTVRVYRGEKVPRDIGGYSALVVLGGPMGVYEEDAYPFIGPEIRLIEKALKEDLPVLGVCLGSQLLARAAGAKVFSGGVKEIGFYTVRLTPEGKKDRLLLGLPDKFTVFQWHGDTFDIPGGAVNLAGSDLFHNQVIRVGRSAYGFQFHFEVTEEMVRDWVDVNAEELSTVRDTIDPEEILARAPLELPVLKGYGDTILKRFFRLIDL